MAIALQYGLSDLLEPSPVDPLGLEEALHKPRVFHQGQDLGGMEEEQLSGPGLHSWCEHKRLPGPLTHCLHLTYQMFHADEVIPPFPLELNRAVHHSLEVTPKDLGECMG